MFVPIAVALPIVFNVCRQITKPCALVAVSTQPTVTCVVLVPSDAVTDVGTAGEPLRVVALAVCDESLMQPPSPTARTRK